jgi:molybdopterin-binding protein
VTPLKARWREDGANVDSSSTNDGYSVAHPHGLALSMTAAQLGTWCATVNASSLLLQENQMRLSARNQLQGTIEEIQLGDVMAHITVRVGENTIESVITRNSAEEMKLGKGDTVKAVVKSTEVMLLKD